MTTVVTIVHNRLRHLRALVTGLQRGVVLPRELIVVVMGGDHPAGRLPPSDVPVRFLDCPTDGPDLPLARARNLGVAATDDDQVILLDVDCIPGASLVGEYHAALAQTDALLMGPVRYLGPWEHDEVPREPDLWARSAAHPARTAPPGGSRLVPTDRYTQFWSLSFAISRSGYLAVGGFDETFVGYGGEDTDFAFNAREAGVPLAWVPHAIAYHQHHPTYDPPLPHVASIVRNARRFHDKWAVWPMEGWLRSFADAGLIAWQPEAEDITVLRLPDESQIAASRRTHAVPG